MIKIYSRKLSQNNNFVFALLLLGIGTMLANNISDDMCDTIHNLFIYCYLLIFFYFILCVAYIVMFINMCNANQIVVRSIIRPIHL